MVSCLLLTDGGSKEALYGALLCLSLSCAPVSSPKHAAQVELPLSWKTIEAATEKIIGEAHRTGILCPTEASARRHRVDGMSLRRVIERGHFSCELDWFSFVSLGEDGVWFTADDRRLSVISPCLSLSPVPSKERHWQKRFLAAPPSPECKREELRVVLCSGEKECENMAASVWLKRREPRSTPRSFGDFQCPTGTDRRLTEGQFSVLACYLADGTRHGPFHSLLDEYTMVVGRYENGAIVESRTVRFPQRTRFVPL